MLLLISRHLLQRKRAQHGAQDPHKGRVHRFYEKKYVICPCCHPNFKKALQILVHMYDGEDCTSGCTGLLLWDRPGRQGRRSTRHFEATGRRLTTAALGWDLRVLPFVWEYRMVPKVPPETCAICLSDVTADHDVTPCGHHFHRTCISQWRQKREVCPLCMAALR